MIPFQMDKSSVRTEAGQRSLGPEPSRKKTKENLMQQTLKIQIVYYKVCVVDQQILLDLNLTLIYPCNKSG